MGVPVRASAALLAILSFTWFCLDERWDSVLKQEADVSF
jgi:hypothetical protein